MKQIGHPLIYSFDLGEVVLHLELKEPHLYIWVRIRKGKGRVSFTGLTKKESIVDIDQPLTEDTC